jgi:hypothetical protein
MIEFVNEGDEDEQEATQLERLDVETILGLESLKSLDLSGFKLSAGACELLRNRSILTGYQASSLTDIRILPMIGSHLLRLDLWCSSDEVVNSIVQCCPKLQYLTIASLCDCYDEEVRDSLAESFKNGLKMLSKLDIDEGAIRLGTDWKGEY